METLWRSRTSTTVVTATGEVQMNEEAYVYVHELHLFVTVQSLEDTLAVLSSAKLCEEHGYTCEWPVVKVTPDQTREEDSLQEAKFRTLCCPWIVVKFWSQFVLYTVCAGLI